MKLEEFKAGVYRQQKEYRSFTPSRINQEWTWDDPRVNVLLERATKSLGELNAFTLIVPNVDLFIRMHMLKEANTSSRIEGTRTEIDEAVLDELEILPERRDDWQEVQNYVEAMNTAITELEYLPLSLRLLRNTHAILMRGVRGERKEPGEFRRSQNCIGGASPSDAVYVPPHPTDISDLLSDLEAFWHNDSIQVPHLVRIAISHYQFEAIHPFLDGNGRIGRLLITLYLVSQGLLGKPSLYLSAHLEKHRSAYFDSLSRVRESDDIGQWCRFFLQAVVETAENGKLTFERILELQQELEATVAKMGRRAENARRLLIHLYQKPSVTINGAMEILEINKNPARQLISDLQEVGILYEATGYKRNRVFFFKRYLDIFRNESEL